MSAAYFQHRNRGKDGVSSDIPVVVDTPTSHPSSTYPLLLPQASIPAYTLASDMRVIKTLASGINADLLLVKYRSGTPHAPTDVNGAAAAATGAKPPNYHHGGGAHYGVVKRFKVPVSTLSRSAFLLLANEVRLLDNSKVVGVPHTTSPHPNVLRPREVWIDNSVQTADSQGTVVFAMPLPSTTATSHRHQHLHLCILYDYQGTEKATKPHSPVGGGGGSSTTTQHCSCGITTHHQTTLEDVIRSGVRLEAFLLRSLLFQSLCGLKHLHGYSSSPNGAADKTPRALHYTPHGDVTPRNMIVTYEKWSDDVMIQKGDEQHRSSSSSHPMVQPHRDGYAHVIRVSYMFSALGEEERGCVPPYRWEWLLKEGPPEVSHHYYTTSSASSSQHHRSDAKMPPTPQSDVWALGACMLALVSQDDTPPPIYPRSRPTTPTPPTSTNTTTSQTIITTTLTSVGSGYSRKISAVLGAMLSPHLLNRPSAQRLLQYYPLFVGTDTSSERCAGIAKGVRSVVRRLERTNNTNNGGSGETVRVVLAPPLGFTLPTPLPIKQVPLLESTTVGWVEWGSNIAVEAAITSSSSSSPINSKKTSTSPRTPTPPPPHQQQQQQSGDDDDDGVSTLTMIQFRGREVGEGWLKVIVQDQMGNHFVLGYVPASLEGSCDHSDDGSQRYELFQICAGTTLEHVRRRRQKAATQEVLLQSLGIYSSNTIGSGGGIDDPDASLGSGVVSIQTSSMGSAMEFMSLITGGGGGSAAASLSGTFGGPVPDRPEAVLTPPSVSVTDGCKPQPKEASRGPGQFTPPPPLSSRRATSDPPPLLHLPPSSAQATAALHPSLHHHEDDEVSILSSLEEGEVDHVTVASLSPHWDAFSTLSPDDKDITASRCCSSRSSRASTPSREANNMEEGECLEYNNSGGGGEGLSPHYVPHSARG